MFWFVILKFPENKNISRYVVLTEDESIIKLFSFYINSSWFQIPILL